MDTVLLALLSIVVSSTCLETGDGHETRWRTEAPPAWAAWEKFLANVSCSIDVVAKSPNKAGPGETGGHGVKERYRVLRNGNWTLVERENETFRLGKAPTFTSTVRGKNSRYSFHLSRRTLDDRYQLTHVGDAGPLVDNEFLGLGEYYYAGIRIPPHQLRDWFALPAVQVQMVSRVPIGDSAVFQVVYRYENPRESVHTGTIRFDPDNHWVINEMAVVFTDRLGRSGKSHCQIEYGEKIKGFAVPKRFTKTQSYDHIPIEYSTIWVAEFTDFEAGNIPEYKFAVSAYGLPEIDPAIKRPWPVWIWCLIGAGVLGALAFATRWYARRRAAA